MWRDTVLVPNELGDFTSAPGNSSDIITIESPILITAFMIVPPGPGAREISFAPNAFLYQSIAWPAPWMARYGVTVRSPGGIALAPADAFRFVAVPRFAFRAMNFPRVGNGVGVLSLAAGGGRNGPASRVGLPDGLPHQHGGAERAESPARAGRPFDTFIPRRAMERAHDRGGGAGSPHAGGAADCRVPPPVRGGLRHRRPGPVRRIRCRAHEVRGDGGPLPGRIVRTRARQRADRHPDRGCLLRAPVHAREARRGGGLPLVAPPRRAGRVR